MAHAWFGDFHNNIVEKITLGKIKPHYLEWARLAHSIVNGSVSMIDGRILHLWHGSSADRKYFDRHIPLLGWDFDPETDIKKNAYGLPGATAGDQSISYCRTSGVLHNEHFFECCSQHLEPLHCEWLRSGKCPNVGRTNTLLLSRRNELRR
jgi:hypothetical protein